MSKIRLASEVTSGILVRNAESYELVDGLGVSFKLTVRREENESKVVWLFEYIVAEIVDYLQVTQWYCHPKQLFLYVSLMKLTTLAIVSYVEPENITISLS